MVIFILLFASGIHLKALVFKWLISKQEYSNWFFHFYIQIITKHNLC